VMRFDHTPTQSGGVDGGRRRGQSGFPFCWSVIGLVVGMGVVRDSPDLSTKSWCLAAVRANEWRYADVNRFLSGLSVSCSCTRSFGSVVLRRIDRTLIGVPSIGV